MRTDKPQRHTRGQGAHGQELTTATATTTRVRCEPPMPPARLACGQLADRR